MGTQPIEGIVYVNYAASGNNDGSSWDNAFTSFQTALDYISDDEQMWVAKGTYQTSYDYGLEIGSVGNHFRLKNNVSIYGGFAGTESSVSQRNITENETILSGLNSNSYHVFNHTNLSLNSTAILDGFTISDGYANGSSPHNDGGGMLNSGSSSGNGSNPTIRNCIFKNNYASEAGGGIYNSRYCSPIISYTTFSNNEAELVGGGIYNIRNNTNISNCIFDSNNIVLASSSNYGGAGIYNSLSAATETIVIEDCTFSNNTIDPDRVGTYGFGAGLYNYSNPGNVTIYNCTFYQNSSKYAAGLYNRGASTSNIVDINNCYFHKNTATYGGGMMNEAYGTNIRNSTFKRNEAVSPGQAGGLYTRGSDVTVVNCLITGNKAYNYGGGTYTNSIITTFINCTIAGNYGSRGGGSAAITGATLIFKNCIIRNNVAKTNGNVVHADASTVTFDYGCYREDTGDIYPTNEGTFTPTNSIVLDPLFTDPIVPTELNTPNDTGDYTLPYSSPCLDVGNNSYISESYDIRGNPHIRKHNKDGGDGIVDMGCYEY